MTLPSTQPVYSTLGADPDLGELVEMFASEMPDRIDNLLRLYNGEDREEFRRAVHQIKGAAGSYGFHAITPSAARLEISLKTEQPEAQIQQELNELLDLCRRVRAGVPE